MFSVKCKLPDGCERVWEVKSVEFFLANHPWPKNRPIARMTPPDSPQGNGESVVVWMEDGHAGIIETGQVFVMNRFGATVATYYLGGWPANSERPPARRGKRVAMPMGV